MEERNGVVYAEKVQFSCCKKVQEVIGGKAKERGVDQIIEGCVATWRRLFLILHIILFHKQPF